MADRQLGVRLSPQRLVELDQLCARHGRAPEGLHAPTPPLDHGAAPRWQVRRKVYRDKAGYLVVRLTHRCNRPMCFGRVPERWFCESEVEARRMIAEAKAGLAPLFDSAIERLIVRGEARLMWTLGYEHPAIDAAIAKEEDS